MTKRIVIVGGGIIGLSIAWRLQAARAADQSASEPHQCMVIDSAPEAREASWAAAGMLAPHNEAQIC